jgi:uncharacterized protein
MRWRRTTNANVEDRRGSSFGRGVALPVGGLGGLAGIIYLVFALLGGGNIDIGPGLDGFGSLPGENGGRLPGAPDPDAELVEFVKFVVADVQNSWREVFQGSGHQYQETNLVLFDQAIPTGCGQGTAETGPFYCPSDTKVYLDLGFFRELRDSFGAPGDFAQAYVIAHEFGHHVQHLLGIDEDVRRAQPDNSNDANELSVRLELQADCFAGVWGHSAFEDQLLESGDLQEGLDAAAAVGDDRIQRQTTGRVNAETWTHGSSDQRVEWFTRGFESGSVDDCNTF